VLFVARKNAKSKRSQHGRRFLLLSILLLLPLAPYAVVEWRTASFKASLLPVTQRTLRDINGSEDPILSFKVLSVGQQEAEVYAVILRRNPKPLCAFALVMTFTNTTKEWQFTGNYRGVWSDCSSASGNIFPPYPARNDYQY
jgi:hypothetical protein